MGGRAAVGNEAVPPPTGPWGLLCPDSLHPKIHPLLGMGFPQKKREREERKMATEKKVAGGAAMKKCNKFLVVL